MQVFRFSSHPMHFLGKRSLYAYLVQYHVWPLLEEMEVIARIWMTILLTVLCSELLYRLFGLILNGRPKRR